MHPGAGIIRVRKIVTSVPGGRAITCERDASVRGARPTPARLSPISQPIPSRDKKCAPLPAE